MALVNGGYLHSHKESSSLKPHTHTQNAMVLSEIQVSDLMVN